MRKPKTIAGTVFEIPQFRTIADDLHVTNTGVYWRQDCHEDGRAVIFRGTNSSQPQIITPMGFDVRSKVQGYGGGAFCVQEGVIYFVNDRDQRIYVQRQGKMPVALTPVGNYTHGDLIFDCKRQRIICVREELIPGEIYPRTQIIAICDCEFPKVKVLIEGADFYASPRLSNCGFFLAWISWQFPHMPWNQSSLHLATLTETGVIHKTIQLAGAKDESIIEPLWGDDGTLYFLSDRNGWWNPYRYHPHTGIHIVVEINIEFGFPPYILGLHNYTCNKNPSSTAKMYAVVFNCGQSQLMSVALESGKTNFLPVPYEEIRCLHYYEDKLWFIGVPIDSPAKIVGYDLQHKQCDTFASLGQQPTFSVSQAQPIQYPTVDGLTNFANFYLPKQYDRNTPPPLLVNVHGGPTGIALASFNPIVQFWIQCGFAYLEVNHRGSTGFGRAYRESLNGQWGMAEVQDCIYGVQYLADRGLIDPTKVAIRGNSAGGYTALRAVAHGNCFAAATCYYGVTDLVQLWKHTHKFESQYLYHLIAPYPMCQVLYEERSPLNEADKIQVPVLFIQGKLDKIVPSTQTRAIVETLVASGKTAIYLEFADEGHGFRKLHNLVTALSTELDFYTKLFDLTLDKRHC